MIKPPFTRERLTSLYQSPLALLFSALFLVSFAGSSVYFKEFRSIPLSDNQPAQSYAAESAVLETSPNDLNQLNVLLVGHGGPGHDGGSLADAIMLVNFDFGAKSVNLISIPRDLSYTFSDGSTNKINSAFARDLSSKDLDFTSTKKAVIDVTGLNVDYLAAIDFVGFQRAIGLNLGGIEVEVKKQFDDLWYPILGEAVNPCGMTPEKITELTQTYSGFELEKQFPCRYKELHYSPRHPRAKSVAKPWSMPVPVTVHLTSIEAAASEKLSWPYQKNFLISKPSTTQLHSSLIWANTSPPILPWI
jgi:hypothetical protein